MNIKPFTQLGGISTEQFLAEYWQQKPLLIRNAIPDFKSPLSPDELAGLAMEEEVESRIVQEQHTEGPWHLSCGPFSEADFSQLPETHWTLLVQAVDQWVDELAELLDRFRFLPNWRLDDIMASYAPKNGSVGPHFDYYDVFLLQGLGRRHWQTGQHCDSRSPLLEDSQLSILSQFNQQESWILEPGDMLYIPPQFAHHGVAMDDCITYSIGFRAPSVADILSDFTTHLASKLTNDQRFSDPKRKPLVNPGQIDKSAIVQLRTHIQETLGNDDEIADWFGAYMTQRKYPELELVEPDLDISPEILLEHLSEGAEVHAHPASRFAWHKNEAGETSLYIDGEVIQCPSEFAQLICSKPQFKAEELADIEPEALQVLCELLIAGSLYLV